jgi:hypothetical protein
MRRRLVVFLFSVLSMAGLAQAGDRVEVAVEANSPISAREFSNADFLGDFTKSGGYQINGRLYFFEKTGLEVGYGFSRNGLNLQDLVGGATFSLPTDEHSFDVNLVHRFATGPIRPWTMIGTGLISYRPRDAAQQNLAQAGFGPIDTVNRPKLNFGVGLDFSLVGPLDVRLALRNFLTQAPNYSTTSGTATFQAPGGVVVFIQPSIGLMLTF